MQKPKGWDEMKRLAFILSEGFPQIRVDSYNINGYIYLRELTLFHFGGDTPFDPECWDEKLDSWIKLPI